MADEFFWWGVALVKLGFIVEGDSEKVLIESEIFNTWLRQLGLELVRPVLNAKGGGNLLPDNIEPLCARLREKEEGLPIVILVDTEEEKPEAVRNRIGTKETHLVFLAVKALEAWFLADSTAMSAWLSQSFYYERPEETQGLPWEELKAITRRLNKRGPGASKPAFAKKITRDYRFDVGRAAKHPACPSAMLFAEGLLELARS